MINTEKNNATSVLTLSSLALLAFAGNSILCRLALSQGLIDPGSFTVIRLVSGALALYLLLNLGLYLTRSTSQSKQPLVSDKSGSWFGGISLFVYAAFFSYAYVSLSTATGALILFGTVQLALTAYGVARGLRLRTVEWFGVLLACVGLCYLLWPELTKPSIMGFVFMVISGLAWAFYTVKGQGSVTPLADTTTNFTLSLPFVGVLFGAMYLGLVPPLLLSTQGMALAVASGVLTSGLGYALWYAALSKISHTTASVSQLSVPVIAALLGLMFANEVIEPRLVFAALLVLGGILLVILSKPNMGKP